MCISSCPALHLEVKTVFHLFPYPLQHINVNCLNSFNNACAKYRKIMYKHVKDTILEVKNLKRYEQDSEMAMWFVYHGQFIAHKTCFKKCPNINKPLSWGSVLLKQYGNLQLVYLKVLVFINHVLKDCFCNCLFKEKQAYITILHLRSHQAFSFGLSRMCLQEVRGFHKPLSQH